jgi:lysine 6-dehydrogenase
MRTIRSLGLLSLDPVHVRGQSVIPRQVFIACVEPRLRRPGARDLVALRILVDGMIQAEARQVGWELVDYYDEEKGISAMERSTGYSLAITATMQIAGDVAGAGVKTPDQAIDGNLYIQRLAERGIRIRRF